MALHAQLRAWATEQVSIFLQYQDTGEMADYLLSSVTENELRDNASQILGSSRKVMSFLDELWMRKELADKETIDPDSSLSKGHAAYNNRLQEVKKKTTINGQSIFGDHVKVVPSKKNKKRNKNNNTTNDEDNNKRERRRCPCQATCHPLFTNCTGCGRVICESEGEGSCFFCGSYVTKKQTQISVEFQDDMRILAKHFIQREETLGLTENENIIALERAEANKERMIAFAASGQAKKNIVDNQSDWYDFNVNAWLTPEQKKERREQVKLMEEEKENIKNSYLVSLDFSGDGSIEVHEIPDDIQATRIAMKQLEEKTIKEEKRKEKYELERKNNALLISNHVFQAKNKTSNKLLHQQQQQEQLQLHQNNHNNNNINNETAEALSYYSYENDTLSGKARKVYEQLLEEKESNRNSSNINHHIISSRVQYDDDDDDDDNNQMNNNNNNENHHDGIISSSNKDLPDHGICLSLHQPWASLVVNGIKVFEGRSWPCKHRGRLWIASTAQEMDDYDLEVIEEYKQVYGKCKIPFPKHYPIGTLLGYVDMIDCWNKEQFSTYKMKNSDLKIENNLSEYVFVFVNPHELKVKQMIRGKHKLWRLDTELHNGIKNKNAVKEINTKWRPTQILKPYFKQQHHLFYHRLDIRPHKNHHISNVNSKNKHEITIIRPGMVLIRNMLTIQQQQTIIDICRKNGIAKNGFFNPVTSDDSFQMYCMGKHWNSSTRSYQYIRRNYDNERVSEIPSKLKEISKNCFELAIFENKQKTGLFSYLSDKEDLGYCDSVIVNYYKPQVGTLPLHQDKDESRNSLYLGKPILSISIGDSASFKYGDNKNGPYESIILHSGDVLIFGGPSRNIYHSIDHVYENTANKELNMIEGRINLTFRYTE